MITCRYRFKEVGWTTRRNEYDAVICEGNSLMAFGFDAPDMKLEYMIGSIKPDEQLEEFKSFDKNDVSGLKIADENYKKTGSVFRFEDKTGYYISIRIKEEESRSICYRVYLNKTGWTDFASDGTVCGELKDVDNYITGIQVFSAPKDSLDQEDILKKADERVKVFNDHLDNSFLYIGSKFRNAEKSSINSRIERDLEVKTVDKGLILPLKTIDTDSRDGIFAGGVCDENGSFVAGLKRKFDKQTNMTVLEGYEVNDSEIEYVDEDVIFGGVIFPGNRRFGHMMIETLSRLWYLVDDQAEASDGNENTRKNGRIAFVILPESDEYNDTFFRLLGIDPGRIMIIKKPTRFRSVVIPEQSFILFSDYHDKCNLIYDKMLSSVQEKSIEKLYLTRRSFTRYDGANDGLNEEYLEEFFKRRGFTVISPEQHPIEDQIAYMKGAREVVCSEGTLSHLGLFCMPGTKLTILRRSINSYLVPQYMIDEMRRLDVSYVDALYNFLPDSHVDSVFLFGPSTCFIEYLKAKGISYTEDEVQMDKSLLYDYLIKYTENFSDPQRFRSISKYDIFDLIVTLNKVLRGEYLSRFDYGTKQYELNAENRELLKRIEDLENKLEKTQEKLNKSEKERKEILNSKSWKITKPLRKLTGK